MDTQVCEPLQSFRACAGPQRYEDGHLERAYAAFEEKERGSLEEGKIADMVILSENPYNVPFESIKNIRVEGLILGGRSYYSAVRPLIPFIWHALTSGGKY